MVVKIIFWTFLFVYTYNKRNNACFKIIKEESSFFLLLALRKIILDCFKYIEKVIDIVKA